PQADEEGGPGVGGDHLDAPRLRQALDRLGAGDPQEITARALVVREQRPALLLALDLVEHRPQAVLQLGTDALLLVDGHRALAARRVERAGPGGREVVVYVGLALRQGRQLGREGAVAVGRPRPGPAAEAVEGDRSRLLAAHAAHQDLSGRHIV